MSDTTIVLSPKQSEFASLVGIAGGEPYLSHGIADTFDHIIRTELNDKLGARTACNFSVNGVWWPQYYDAGRDEYCLDFGARIYLDARTLFMVRGDTLDQFMADLHRVIICPHSTSSSETKDHVLAMLTRLGYIHILNDDSDDNTWDSPGFKVGFIGAYDHPDYGRRFKAEIELYPTMYTIEIDIKAVFDSSDRQVLLKKIELWASANYAVLTARDLQQ